MTSHQVSSPKGFRRSTPAARRFGLLLMVAVLGATSALGQGPQVPGSGTMPPWTGPAAGSPAPPTWTPRDVSLEDLEFLVVQPFVLASAGVSLGVAIGGGAGQPQVALGMLGGLSGVLIGAMHLGIRPPPIYAQAINSGALWGLALSIPIQDARFSAPGLQPLVTIPTLLGAIGMGLWAHSGTLSQGQLSLINSAGIWTALGTTFALLPGAQVSLGGYGLDERLITMGASVAAAALAGWLGRDTGMGRLAGLFMDLGAVCGYAVSYFVVSAVGTGPFHNLGTAAALALIPAACALLSVTLAHRVVQHASAAELQVQLAPMLSEKQQGLALVGRF